MVAQQQKFWLMAFAGMAILLGIYARFKGLGVWPLAVDEYYLTRSIFNVLGAGLPEFDCGGFYTRGLLQQYLTAPLIALGLPTEFAVRLVPVFSNLLTIPALFFIVRKAVNSPAAYIAVALFALSLWQVEFARFARMYAPFQCIFAWQLWYLIRALEDDNPRRMTGLWSILAISLLSTLVYEGAIFVILLGYVPIILLRVRPVSLYSGLLFGITLIALFLQVTDWRHIGVTEYLPDGVTIENLDLQKRLPVALPELALQQVFSMTVLLCAAAVFFTGIWGVNTSKITKPTTERIFFFYIPGLLSIILAANNLLLLAWTCLAISLCLQAFQQTLSIREYRRWCFWLMAITLTWIGVLAMQDDLTAFKSYPDHSHYRAIFDALFLYPDVYTRVLGQWLEAIPVQTALLMGGCTISFLFIALGKQLSRFEPLLMMGLIGFILIISVLETTYQTPRYSYFIYPLFLACALCGFTHLVKACKPKLQGYLTVVLVGMTLGVSDDFSIDHLLNIDSQTINFRENMPKAQGNLYYAREDYRSVAEYIEQHIQPGEHVVSFHPVVDFYYPDIDAIFVPLYSEKFVILSACRGQNELWSNANLLYTPEQLDAFVAEKPTWVVLKSSEKATYAEERELWEKQTSNIVHSSLDKRVHVMYIK